MLGIHNQIQQSKTSRELAFLFLLFAGIFSTNLICQNLDIHSSVSVKGSLTEKFTKGQRKLQLFSSMDFYPRQFTEAKQHQNQLIQHMDQCQHAEEPCPGSYYMQGNSRCSCQTIQMPCPGSYQFPSSLTFSASKSFYF